MSTFCKYKDVFGEPGEGVHSYRIFNIAVVDVIVTIVVAALVNYFLDYGFLPTLAFLFTLGIILHSIFCVKTTINMWLFSR
jgi:hypothetical protein